LHRRSGFPTHLLAELHGNTNLESCEKCGKQYLRDFRCRVRKDPQHYTGRKCTMSQCSGKLRDSIINFGENLPEKPLDDAGLHSEKADVCLAMGSSLTVTPAADFPKLVGKSKKLVIVNLQKTPLDRYATIRINAKCDDVMKLLMEELKLEIPEWRLIRYLKVRLEPMKNNTEELQAHFAGVESDGLPASFLESISLTMSGDKRAQGKDNIDQSLIDEAVFEGLKRRPGGRTNNDHKEDEKKRRNKIRGICRGIEFYRAL